MCASTQSPMDLGPGAVRIAAAQQRVSKRAIHKFSRAQNEKGAECTHGVGSSILQVSALRSK